MHRRQLLALPVLLAAASVLPSLFAQSNSLNLGAKLTRSSEFNTAGLGAQIAFSGDSIVSVGQAYYPNGGNNVVYVFQRKPGGWSSETQTSVLTASDGNPNFGEGFLAMDGDTVVVGAGDKVYIFERPAAGWKSMHEIAQLTLPSGFLSGLAIVGDTIAAGSFESAYIFVKPAGGWVTTSTYAAQLTLPSPAGTYLQTLAFNGDTIAFSTIGASQGVYVFPEPQGGWATTGQPAALLTRANFTGQEAFGYSIAIAGDTIAVGAYAAQDANGEMGAVDIFVKPAAGWKNMTERAELYPPVTTDPGVNLGSSVAMDSEHLVAGTGGTEFYVYSKPATGWKSGAWPSQVFVGQSNFTGGFGALVALQEDILVTGAFAATVNGTNVGAIYVFPLFPSSIQISSDHLEYPDMSLGSAEVLPLTITNPSASTLNFNTWISSGNYQILNTAENTCYGGVVPAGQSCTLPIQFDPPAVGQHTNYLTLSSPSTASFRIVRLRGLAEDLGANSQ
jgi:hypothetical protein